MEHKAYCWLSGGPNVSSFLRGDVLVNGCELWMIHGVCQADRLRGWQVQGPPDCVMVHGAVLVQYYLVFMSPCHLLDVQVFLQVAPLLEGTSVPLPENHPLVGWYLRNK